MNKEKVSQVEADEQILTSDVPDDVLEAASTEQKVAFLALRQLGDIRRDTRK